MGQWFHKRKAFALGLVLMGSSTGIRYHSSSFVDSRYLSVVCRRCSTPNLSPDPHQGDRVACSCSLLRSDHSSSEHAGMSTHERLSTEEEMGSESTLLRFCVIRISSLQRLFSGDFLRSVSHIHLPPNIMSYNNLEQSLTKMLLAAGDSSRPGTTSQP